MLGGLYLVGVGSVVMESTCTVAMVVVISEVQVFNGEFKIWLGHIPEKVMSHIDFRFENDCRHMGEGPWK